MKFHRQNRKKTLKPQKIINLRKQLKNLKLRLCYPQIHLQRRRHNQQENRRLFKLNKNRQALRAAFLLPSVPMRRQAG